MTLIEAVEQLKKIAESYPELRAETKWFVGEMEKQLKANEHKGGWQDCDSSFLLEELDKNRIKLFWMTKSDTKADICRRAANIANFAMMIADNARRGGGPATDAPMTG